MKKLLRAAGSLAIFSLVLTTLTFFSPPQASEAADASQFDAGNIISDALFFEGQAMTVNEIQSFLVAQVPVCHSSYACLSTYRQNTPTIAGVSGRCSTYDGRNNESAADIIYRVGVACGISSKAMLVLLEKEQSLVTSSTPSKGRFDSATGMGCPDTAPCDPSFGGLFYQIYYAARQFKTYAAVPSAFNYQAGRVNYILYSPNRDCGSSAVFIGNQATAGLYNYTPYQPNAAALNNLYGTGDGCSAYGNRNFWRIYTDWFGSTQANTDGAKAIGALYSSLGGAGSALGAQLSAVVCTSSYRDCGVSYRAGSIYWSNRTGAFPVYDANGVRGTYWATGGSAGPLGEPTSNPIPIADNGGGVGQAFESGSIYSGNSIGAVPVYEPVRSAYFVTNGASGGFGWPNGSQFCGSIGCTQSFQNGFIGTSSGTGVYVTGAMASFYRAAGGPGGSLGVAASSEVAIPQNGAGTGQAFANGSVYSSATGRFAVEANLRNAYFNLGGSAGSLGWPTSARKCSAAGCIQAFQTGYLSANSPTSFQVVTGKMAEAYNAAGGMSGSLGVAISPVVSIPQNGGGTGQAFDGGSIYSSAATGVFAVVGAIKDAYFASGGAAGSMGWPTAAQTCTLAGGGCQQAFQKATVFSLAGKTATISNDIAAGYAAAGGLGGTLGNPTSALIPIPQNGGGNGQVFLGGSVYAAAPGSFAVTGKIRDEYFRLGGAAGKLGWPTGATSCAFAGGVCGQSYQGGSVYSSSGAVYSVTDGFAASYSALGGPGGSYGLPASGQIPIADNGGGLGQVFQNGSIYSSSAGTFGVSGAIRGYYFAQSGASGALGWPTGAAGCSLPGGACSQAFQGGTVFSSSAGTILVSNPILSSYTTLGGAKGAFGLPTSSIIPIAQNGGGFGQVFQNGSIYSSASGTFGVTGAIRDEYFRQGGSAGALGWPKGNAVCKAGSASCTQSFQGGSITR